MIDFDMLHRLHIVEKVPTEEIGRRLGLSGRAIRHKMLALGIPRMGTIFRRGQSATWNIGLKRSAETIEKTREANIGRAPPNKGKGRVAVECAACKTQFFDKPYRRSIYCSRACQDTHMMRRRGQDHFRFRADLPYGNQRERNWAIAREWKDAVIAASNMTCVACGSLSNKLETHHLNSWAAFPEDRYRVANGVALCRGCHRGFHAAYGRHRNTREQFAEWITNR